MTLITRSLPVSRLLLVATSLSLLPMSMPAAAQRTVEGRVEKLEKEMQAVQRKVFPGGAGQIVAPDITPSAAPTPQIGSPATAPIADLTARVNAIESQLARLTGQVEVTDNRVRLLEDANKALIAQIQALQQAQASAPAETGQGSLPAWATTVPAKPAAAAPTTPSRTPAATPARTPAAPAQAGNQARVQAVAAIERPSTGNAAQDAYTYGFRLWTAKFYPEAQAQLEDTVAKHGNDPVASRAANLLGRAYLDDNKPTQAAKTLFENYRARPKGDRAAESLAWVGEALIQIDQPKNACVAYEELEATFGVSMPGNVRDMMTKGKVRAKCGG
jgi:TolA-binding protein